MTVVISFCKMNFGICAMFCILRFYFNAFILELSGSLLCFENLVDI